MKRILYALTLVLGFTMVISPAFAADKEKPKVELTAAEKAELEQIKARVQAIKEMDKSQLSRAERKALRKELKEMKKRADFLGQGVYLSVGAIIIILLILILIL